MKNVVVFTSNTWGYCHEVKKYLEDLGVEYTEKNVTEDKLARKELMSQGFMGVPVIYVGEEIIQGFDKNRLEELLKD